MRLMYLHSAVVRKADRKSRRKPVSTKEVYEFARGKLATYKALNGGVVFVDASPRTASGKIQRFKCLQLDEHRVPGNPSPQRSALKRRAQGQPEHTKRQALEGNGTRRSLRLAECAKRLL